jgi:hypothetical protein
MQQGHAASLTIFCDLLNAADLSGDSAQPSIVSARLHRHVSMSLCMPDERLAISESATGEDLIPARSGVITLSWVAMVSLSRVVHTRMFHRNAIS